MKESNKFQGEQKRRYFSACIRAHVPMNRESQGRDGETGILKYCRINFYSINIYRQQFYSTCSVTNNKQFNNNLCRQNYYTNALAAMRT